MHKSKAKKNISDPVKRNDKSASILKEMNAIMEKVQVSKTTHNKFIKELHRLLTEVHLLICCILFYESVMI